MEPKSRLSPRTSPSAIIVQQGKLLDFIDGITQRKETPEEYVRQEIAKSLVREYGYPKDHIKVEFTLKFGTRKPRVDLSIFPDSERHVQGRIYIIVECKAPSVSASDRNEGVEQLRSYMAACENVSFGMWTNGVERFCYKRIFTNGVADTVEVVDIPEFGKSEDEAERPQFDQLKPANSDALLFAFRRSHNFIAANQGLPKTQAFWELLKLIFCKIHDERNSSEVQFYATSIERKSLNGLIRVKGRTEAIFEEVKEDFPLIFGEAEAIELEPRVLAYLIGQLQMYSLLDSDTDVKGRAYEEIVGSNLRGDRGEFFTPRNICRMAVGMLDPSEKQLMLDPACGTSGFLITAMNHVIRKIESSELERWGNDLSRARKTTRDRVRKFAEKFIVGIDFNPELVKASKMNMVMNNDGAGGLYQANSLDRPVLWRDDLRSRNLLGKVDLIFTNPPFGSKLPITDSSILEQFDLGHSWNYDNESDRWEMRDSLQQSQPPEILFIERIVQFLKPGSGRAAVVLPDGILGSPGLGYVRQWILERCRILASIDLHPDTFQPFVSIQTSLLVFERKSNEQIALELAAGRSNDYNVFMAVADHIGHDKRGAYTYVRDEFGNEIVEEFTDESREIVDGIPVIRPQQVRRKVLDDSTQLIAAEFRQWLIEQN